MQYYKSAGGNSEYIVTLEIPNDAKTNLDRQNIVDSKYAKYRCSNALVVDIEHKVTKEKENSVVSNYSEKFVYKLNKNTESSFDCNLENVCTGGIHFFKTKEQALMYGTIPKDGEYKMWHDNGQLGEECVYKDGNREGEYKKWYENGQLYIERVYKDGKREGEFKEWYRPEDGGQLKEECVYKDGKREGEYKTWHENGQLWVECVYKDGKKEDKYKMWYRYGGQLWPESVYKNGKRVSYKNGT